MSIGHENDSAVQSHVYNVCYSEITEDCLTRLLHAPLKTSTVKAQWWCTSAHSTERSTPAVHVWKLADDLRSLRSYLARLQERSNSLHCLKTSFSPAAPVCTGRKIVSIYFYIRNHSFANSAVAPHVSKTRLWTTRRNTTFASCIPSDFRLTQLSSQHYVTRMSAKLDS